MLSFNAIINEDQAQEVVLLYRPRKIEEVQNEQVQGFAKLQKEFDSGFRVEQIVAESIGLNEQKKHEEEQEIERRVLERVQAIQEQAYHEGYRLGLDEGKVEAVTSYSNEIQERLASFKVLIESLERLGAQLVDYNEARLVKLTYYLAKRIALREIQSDPSLILDIIRQAVQQAQTEDNINVLLSKADYDFLVQVRSSLKDDQRLGDSVNLIARDSVAPGGCVIQTNFGEVDSSLDSRIEKLWQTLQGALPRTKESLE